MKGSAEMPSLCCVPVKTACFFFRQIPVRDEERIWRWQSQVEAVVQRYVNVSGMHVIWRPASHGTQHCLY